MYKVLLIALFSTVGNSAFSQVKIDGATNTIIINATSPIDYECEIDYLKSKGENSSTFTYEITIPKYFTLSIARNATLQPILSFEKQNIVGIIDTTAATYTGKITFNRNTENVFTIAKGEEKFTYKIKTKSVRSWTTTFGVNSIFSSERSKFIASEKDGVHTVSEVKDNKMLDLMPAVMFTFINKQKDFSLGFTGGLGTNFEEITIYSGFSIGIGQNIILTSGLSVNKQLTTNSNYSVGQEIPSSITTENLNESQYRVNPFIGISFRLDKNPFGRKTD